MSKFVVIGYCARTGKEVGRAVYPSEEKAEKALNGYVIKAYNGVDIIRGKHCVEQVKLTEEEENEQSKTIPRR